MSPETKELIVWLVLIHNVFNALAFPFSGVLSNGLRAAGDPGCSFLLAATVREMEEVSGNIGKWNQDI